jgi:hypothetical protein
VPVRIAGLIAAVPIALLALAGSVPPAAAEMPRSAAAFRDSVGVNTHVSYFNTPYGRWPAVVDKLEALGVTHLRDGAFANPAWRDWNRRYYAGIQAAAARGMRFNLIMARPGSEAGTLGQLVAAVAGPLAGAVESVEGPNEYDIAGVASWAKPLRSYQQELYDKVKAHPALRRIRVVGPSLVWASSRATLGNLESALDIGNMHPYTGGQSPSPAAMANEIALARRVSHGKPIFATEAGFHNSVAATSGQPGVPESVAAVYTLRTYLENFLAGVDRTYVYELIDEFTDPGGKNPEAHFGLLRNDFTEKPAFVALKNLLDILGTPTRLDDPRDLPLKLTGETAGVQHLLLQRDDGSYVVLLWRGASLWDTASKRPRTVPPKAVTLAVGKPITAVLYQPVRSGSGRTIPIAAGGTSLELSEDPVALEIPAEAASTSSETLTGAPVSTSRPGGQAAEPRGDLRATLRRWIRDLRWSGRYLRVALRRIPEAGTLRAELYRRRAGRRSHRSQVQVLAASSATVKPTGRDLVLRLRHPGRDPRASSLRVRLTFTSLDKRRTSVSGRLPRPPA